MIAKPLMFYFVLLLFFVPAALGADGRYSIHTSGLNSSVYVNMLYFANLVNQYATDFTLVALPSEGGPTNMISVNAGAHPSGPAPRNLSRRRMTVQASLRVSRKQEFVMSRVLVSA